MLIGILLGIAIMLVLFLCLFLGYKLGHKTKPIENKLTPLEKEELKRREEGFLNIMNYDYNKALERGKQ